MPLYRSSGGQLACADHAPLLEVARWSVEQWRRVPPGEVETRRLTCEHCPAEQPESGDPRIRDPKPLVVNVDDRRASQYLRERALRASGFVVVNADTGSEALDLVRRLQPSLVLLDVHLPDVDGRDLCRQIKDDGELGNIPVVLISSTMKGHSASLEGLRWSHADGYISEPCEDQALISMLRSLTVGLHRTS